jgi:hypothetical protein
VSYVRADQLLHRWNCAISDALAKLRDGVTQDDGNAAHGIEYRPTARKGTALLTVTVNEADVSKVRGALSDCTPNCVGFIKLTRIPSDNRVRLQIALKTEAVSEAMSKIIGSVDEAEFGRIAVTANHSRLKGLQQVLHRWSGASSYPAHRQMTRGSLG